MKYLEIETTQNVVIRHELASFSDRIVAYIIDILITFGAAIILHSIFTASRLFGLTGLTISTFFSVSIILFYHLAMEAFAGGRSFGKRFMKIIPVKSNGESITIKDYLLRWIFRLPDILLTSGVLAALLVYSTSTAQRLGDIVAKTVVIKTGGMNQTDLNRILKMNKQQKNYSPKYPQAKQLTDQDIMIIKDVIRRVESGEDNEPSLTALAKLISKIEERLEIKVSGDKVLFLKKLMTDYIYLTR